MKKPLRSQDLFIFALVVFFLLWPLAKMGTALHYRVLGFAFYYGTLAFAWNLLALTGVVSLGHAAFFGLGAYGSALLDHYWRLSPCVTILAGGLLGASYGILWHLAFRKLRGAPFALATLASVEIPKILIDNWDRVTLGSQGITGIADIPSLRWGGTVIRFSQDPEALYYLLFTWMLVTGWVHWKAIRSRWGWAIRAIREDEIAAAGLGVNVHRTRFHALLLSALFTALCGALYPHMIGLVEPSLVFSLHMSALPLIFSIFGGTYQPHGPILGALILYPLDQLLFHSLLPVGHAAVYGLVVILALLFFPRGVGAWLQSRLRSAWN
ncbi:MAG: branched-chain amino acid ABC transporter permease [Syntrophobacteraceae bacterium]|nr:branched-chain amino acid ABC transporter permease [Syntrophobacteraceae bacterium]